MPFVSDMTQTLHKLLRGEMAAVEAYEEALRRLPPTDADVGTLTRITREHAESVDILRERLENEGEEPDKSSGAWGAYARFLERAGEWVGDDLGLKMLNEGEVHGLSDYRTSLGHEDLPSELRRSIEKVLIPRQQEHIATMDKVLKARERTRHGT